MPYFVFSIKPFLPFERLAEFASFKEASAHAKILRANPDLVAQTKIKVMFADNQQLAEDLLSQVREAGPTGDE